MRDIASSWAIPRDRVLLRWTVLLFVIWLAWTGPIRWLSGAMLPAWVLGSAPSFFAGLTLTFWQAFAVPGRAAGSAAVAFLVLVGVEIIQMFMPQHRADLWDVLASLLGCGLACAVLHWRAHKVLPVV